MRWHLEGILCSVNHAASQYNSCKWPTWRTIPFSICLFQFSTCFEQPRAHHQENQLYQYNYPVCVTACRWPSSSFPTCILDGHLQRVTHTRCCMTNMTHNSFSICLFHFSTCFEQPRAHHQENQLHQYNIWYVSLCVGDRLFPSRPAF
jgi:hypothetical protein